MRQTKVGVNNCSRIEIKDVATRKKSVQLPFFAHFSTSTHKNFCAVAHIRFLVSFCSATDCGTKWSTQGKGFSAPRGIFAWQKFYPYSPSSYYYKTQSPSVKLGERKKHESFRVAQSVRATLPLQTATPWILRISSEFKIKIKDYSISSSIVIQINLTFIQIRILTFECKLWNLFAKLLATDLCRQRTCHVSEFNA